MATEERGLPLIVLPILHQFNQFDTDGDGSLSGAELEKLATARAQVEVAPKVAAKLERLEGGSAHTSDGKRSSKRWPDGTTYDGEWQANQPQGVGVTTWPDGSDYTGEHRQGKPHGEGTCRMPGGDTYVGGFRHGQWEGRGVLRHANEARWEGAWQAGRKHGRGAHVSPNGTREEGEWIEGTRTHFCAPSDPKVKRASSGQLRQDYQGRGGLEGRGLLRE